MSSITTADLVALQQSIQQSIIGVSAKSEANIKKFIDDALGKVNERVTTVEANVATLQMEVTDIRSQLDQLKGDKSPSNNYVIDILPSLVAAERVAFSKILIIKGAMITNVSDLNKFSTDLLNVLEVSNVTVQSVSFMGKAREGQERLIRLEVEEASHALLILKGKRKLQSIDGWSNIFINQMRSSMVGKLERRMNGFYRTNLEKIKMKKFHDCIQFIESGTRVPVHKFGAAEIQVGQQVFAVSNTVPASSHSQPLTSEKGTSSPIPQTNNQNCRKTRSATQAAAKTKPIKGASNSKQKKPRITPYTRGRNVPGTSADNGDDNDYLDMDDTEDFNQPTHLPEISNK
jgi:hypothetical protein